MEKNFLWGGPVLIPNLTLLTFSHPRREIGYWFALLVTMLVKEDLIRRELVHRFEDLLFAQHPTLFLHLLALKVNPLEIAFPWIHLAFTGTIPVEEVLLLLDRLVAYNDLVLIPVLAVAIFGFRSEVLLACTSKEQVLGVFDAGQLNRIKTVPLLQGFLFLDQLK